MPTVDANGITLWYETFGDVADPALLFVSGLGSQALSWDVELCEAFVDRGFFVIRFDNRDVGLSTKVDTSIEFGPTFSAMQRGEHPEVPYKLSDMAADAIAVLDAAGVGAAHVVGASMGGMIAQTLAIEHPERVTTLTSIMSTTGERGVGQPKPEAAAVLFSPPPREREARIANDVETRRVIGSPEHFNEERARALATASFDRCFAPEGVARQLLAVGASGNRAKALAQLDVPTLVIHGDLDPLIPVDGGQRTAELIPGAELVVIEGMAHDLPPFLWPQIIEPITRLAATAASA